MPETITRVLNKVNSPEDLRKLEMSDLYKLADEMRELIIKKVNTTGGHLGPNLGIVETTIAMHYVSILLLISLYLMFHINATRIK